MSETENSSVDVKMKLYALYLKDLQSIGSRHEHVRKYYLTLISAIFTILSLGGTSLAFGVTPGLVRLVSIFGASLCVLWLLNMKSFNTLFEAKFNVLEEMEIQLPCQPFTRERIEKKKPGINHHSMLKFDMGIAAIFAVLFLVLPLLTRAAHE